MERRKNAQKHIKMSTPIYNTEQIKAWDKFTIKNEPIASIDLMERATHQCVDYILNENENLVSINNYNLK